MDQTLILHRNFYNAGHTRSLKFRLHQLANLKDLIQRNEQVLCQAVYEDLKRDHGLTKQLELAQCLTEIDYFSRNLKHWMEPERVEKTLSQAMDQPFIVKEPYGTVLLMTTWNFPILMCFFPLIPIIAAGNTVVMKCSEHCPASVTVVEKLMREYFDPDYISVVTGGPEVASEVLKHKFDKIMYTGSPNVGKIIMEAASKHLTPCVLELGGKCPVVVLPDTDVSIAARRIVWAKLVNSGQVCITADYLLVHSDILDQFIAECHKVITEFYGEHVKNSKDYCRIINGSHFNRLNNLLLASKGHVVLQYGQPDLEDLFFPPTLVQIGLNDPLMADEIFGPILPILSIQSLEDGIKFINARNTPLAAYIFSKCHKSIDKFIHQVPSGGIVANDLLVHFFSDTLPFGGCGTSGMGVYRGKHGFDEFTHQKAVIKKGYFGEVLAESRYPPFSQAKYSRLAFLLTRRDFPPKILRFIGNHWCGILFGIAISALLQAIRHRIPFLKY
ncbi:unnamed protein product [Bursaphelenchus xylophilus]|uniref:Aldehyde dehydrogenase n=1 Tax=Bursaphelenchus xylophilus TaxID=6326 RepID=A0A1I7RHU1_BURXY|nr:unnamed protein product [Bursaphelenchus xylophilus]CAG9115384.1 unnamed protein product [Bursaphelenchus xylophilus]